MPGQASACALESRSAGLVEARVPGSVALTIVDGRPVRFSEGEVAQAEADHALRAGAQVESVRAKVAEAFQAVRADLNATAGGQASPRVMVLAHHAQLAHQALVLQSLAAEKAFGEEAKLQDNALRNTAGLSVVATDALNKAYEAAREEGKAKQPTGLPGLMASIGVGQPGPGSHETQRPEVRSDPPFSPPGGSTVGSPSSPPRPPKNK